MNFAKIINYDDLLTRIGAAGHREWLATALLYTPMRELADFELARACLLAKDLPMLGMILEEDMPMHRTRRKLLAASFHRLAYPRVMDKLIGPYPAMAASRRLLAALEEFDRDWPEEVKGVPA